MKNLILIIVYISIVTSQYYLVRHIYDKVDEKKRYPRLLAVYAAAFVVAYLTGCYTV